MNPDKLTSKLTNGTPLTGEEAKYLIDLVERLTDIEAECAKEKENALTSQKREIREKVQEVIKTRIGQCELLIEASKKKQELYDGYTPEERISDETAKKVAFEVLLPDILALLDNNK